MHWQPVSEHCHRVSYSADDQEVVILPTSKIQNISTEYKVTCTCGDMYSNISMLVENFYLCIQAFKHCIEAQCWHLTDEWSWWSEIAAYMACTCGINLTDFFITSQVETVSLNWHIHDIWMAQSAQSSMASHTECFDHSTQQHSQPPALITGCVEPHNLVLQAGWQTQ